MKKRQQTFLRKWLLSFWKRNVFQNENWSEEGGWHETYFPLLHLPNSRGLAKHRSKKNINNTFDLFDCCTGESCLCRISFLQISMHAGNPSISANAYSNKWFFRIISRKNTRFTKPLIFCDNTSDGMVNKIGVGEKQQFNY